MKLRVYFLGNFLYWIYHHTPLENLFQLYYYTEFDDIGKERHEYIECGEYIERGEYIEIRKKFRKK